MHHEARHVAAGRIDLVKRGQTFFLELIGSPAADDLHPMRRRRALRLILEHAQRKRERGHAIPANFLRIGQTAANEMGMRVIEPGNDGAAARIDDLGRRPAHGFKLAAHADPDDLVATNRDRLPARSSWHRASRSWRSQ